MIARRFGLSPMVVDEWFALPAKSINRLVQSGIDRRLTESVEAHDAQAA
ncbi:hypothetical protein [Paraburkholderia terricola]|uniref:Uncharacterized protein n=1 Tax=Paraburkholderia terricola TaxID=169427 RepID=A0ABU1LXB2_9BURK|nr:hypothetical protein [Paraburkholderia terricola]MDR6411388.1 hypothetical protein [Paraburkholderia terricola]MDR6483372.1 hypothetical protein [Paraburkholderia terricola]